MAQYLVLGRFIGAIPQSCIIVHDTVNASLFQDMNKYPLRNDISDATLVPPIIKSPLKVY